MKAPPEGKGWTKADAERYVLTANQRGQLKLIDQRRGGRYRNVVSIRSR